jgi:hypothetical protein
MATSGRDSGVVGYNVQVAVDTEHHLLVTHEVTNVGPLTPRTRVAKQAKAALQTETLEAVSPRWLAATAASASRCRREIARGQGDAAMAAR